MQSCFFFLFQFLWRRMQSWFIHVRMHRSCF
jgi:hypothetical protein